jgi:hypothetical protein
VRDPGGTLWVGTYGGGISRFDDRSRRFDNLRPGPEDGLHLSSGRVTASAHSLRTGTRKMEYGLHIADFTWSGGQREHAIEMRRRGGRLDEGGFDFLVL